MENALLRFLSVEDKLLLSPKPVWFSALYIHRNLRRPAPPQCLPTGPHLTLPAATQWRVQRERLSEAATIRGAPSGRRSRSPHIPPLTKNHTSHHIKTQTKKLNFTYRVGRQSIIQHVVHAILLLIDPVRVTRACSPTSDRNVELSFFMIF